MPFYFVKSNIIQGRIQKFAKGGPVPFPLLPFLSSPFPSPSLLLFLPSPLSPPRDLKTVQQRNVQIREIGQCCVAFNPSGLTKWFYLPLERFLSVLFKVLHHLTIWRRFRMTLIMIRLAGYIISVFTVTEVLIRFHSIVITGFSTAIAVVTFYRSYTSTEFAVCLSTACSNCLWRLEEYLKNNPTDSKTEIIFRSGDRHISATGRGS